MQTPFELEGVSVRLYKYLCDEVVGSENIVRYRRLYYNLHDNISKDNKIEVISSGSKAEGLDFPGSDFDVMFLMKSWEVYEDKPKDKEDVLILDTANALPGFALLKKSDKSSFPCPLSKTDNGNLIANNELLKLFFSEIAKSIPIFAINGPSISYSFFVDIDTIYCLKCHTWPTIAKQWLLRFRPSGWPTEDIISRILSQGCLLVPVGSKSSDSEGNPFEWRFSFSLSEKLLVYSFNHTQLLCYALLKICLKEILNRNNKIKDKLCSYFMKTLLFWILEEVEDSYWIPQNLLHCLLICFQRLHNWIKCGYFPNYFIPEHNMIDGKLSHDELKYLSLTLDEVNMRENWKIIFSGPTLCNFYQLPKGIQRKPNGLREFDKVMLSLQTVGSLLDAINQWRVDSKSACIMYRMIHNHLSNSARKILMLMFLKDNLNILASIDFVNCTNKRSYNGYKECLSRILINTLLYNAEFGWLLLAAFFHSAKNYPNMYRILQLSSSIFSLINFCVQNDENVETFRDISKLRKMVYSGSFIDRMRFERSRVFHIDIESFEPTNFPFLTDEIPNLGFIGGLQLHSLFLFLKIVYDRKQGHSLESKSALKLLKTNVEEVFAKSTSGVRIISSGILLEKAFELSNDIEGVCNL